MSDPVVSFIIVCYNSEKYVTKCINSVLNQSYHNYEIIVIDNNSSDNTKNLLEDFVKNNQIKLIQNHENVGYGTAITMATKISKGEFLAILNADVVLDSAWTLNLLNVFKSDSNVMSASGDVYFPNGELQTAGGLMDKYGAVIQKKSKNFYSRNIKENAVFYNDGSSFMIRRKILDKVNLDTSLFLYYEDVDLAWKIRILGYKIEFVEKAISHHDMGHSYGDVTPTKFYFQAKNRIYICMKNYSLKNVIKRIPVTIFLVFLNSLFYDMSRGPRGYIQQFFRAAFWNISHISLIINERKKLHALKKISDKEIDLFLIQRSIELPFIKSKSVTKKI